MSFYSFQHPVMDFKNFSIPSSASHHALVDGIHVQQLIKKINEKIDFMLSSK